MLLRHPVIRACIVSGCSNAAGDLLCQAIRCKAAGKDVRVNWRQTMRFGIVGVGLHGPYFYHAFRWLDARFGTATTLQRAALKSMVGQVTVFPVYLSAFYLCMGCLEGLSPRQCTSKMQQAFAPTFLAGCLFWPFANVANFMFVPPGGRVVYANAAGLIWNSVLSFQNSTRGALAAAGSSGKAD